MLPSFGVLHVLLIPRLVIHASAMDGKTQIHRQPLVWTCSRKQPAWASLAAAVDMLWVQTTPTHTQTHTLPSTPPALLPVAIKTVFHCLTPQMFVHWLKSSVFLYLMPPLQLIMCPTWRMSQRMRLTGCWEWWWMLRTSLCLCTKRKTLIPNRSTSTYSR